MNYKKVNILDCSLEEYENYKLNNGIIDKYGNLYIFDKGLKDTHELLGEYLKIEYFLRVSYFLKYNDGMISPQYFDVINDKMALCIYNILSFKKDSKLTTFEEKLAKYVSDLGYYSTVFNNVPQIYDHKLFNENMNVLSYTLGNKFDKSFFVDILNN